MNLCGVDLTDAVFKESASKTRVDDSLGFRDVTGSIFGSTKVVQDDVVQTLTGNERESGSGAGAVTCVLEPEQY